MSPQTTGASEQDLVDARLQRLKLEGTPRVKRERRKPAPPISPLPDTADFSDFMIPQLNDGESVDYGTLAQRMMMDLELFPRGGEGRSSTPKSAQRPLSDETPSRVLGPNSPNGSMRHLTPERETSPALSFEMPIDVALISSHGSPSPLVRVDEADEEEQDEDDDDEGH